MPANSLPEMEKKMKQKQSKANEVAEGDDEEEEAQKQHENMTTAVTKREKTNISHLQLTLIAAV